jgi:RNA polymerase sigma factor (sigma-70 family)
MNRFLRRLTRGMAAERLVEQSDRQLVERVLAGPDEAAFEALVRRHGPMAYRVCWRGLQHAENTEDAFQATFLVLARNLSSVKKRDSLASWLHGVAQRVALDAKKQAAKRHRHEAHAAVPRGGPPDEITWRELRAVLDAELASLPEKFRLPLILCCLEGQSQEEAARRLRWSKSTLLRRLQEARAALGRRLARKGFIWPATSAAVLISDCVAPAALSSKLIGSTVEEAARAVVGSVAAGIVSTKVIALTEGVVNAMFMSKMKSVAAGLILGGALMSGALAFFGKGLTGLPRLGAASAPQDYPTAPVLSSTPPGVPAGAQLAEVIVREDAQVAQLVWSADSRVVATVSIAFDVGEVRDSNGDNPQKVLSARSTVKLWDSRTHKLIKSLGEEKKTMIETIVFSPNKKHVAIAGFRELPPGKPVRDHFVRILDAETWEVKQEPDLDVRPSAFAFSPDGKTLAMGGFSPLAENGYWVKLWDLQGEKMKDVTRFAPAGAEGSPDLKAEAPEWQMQSFCLLA